MEEQLRGAVQAIPKSVKKTVVSDIAAIVCMCAALIFMVVFSLVILPKQIQTPQSDNVTGAVVQGFALGLAQAVKIVISVLFAIAYLVFAIVGTVMLDISLQEYIKFSVDTFELDNFLVGVFHGFLYGMIISLCGCYYGVNCGRNADSVGMAATKAVVSAIVWMIVVTGILTFIFKVLGI